MSRSQSQISNFKSQIVLFEDADLLVVNKPAGLTTIPGRQGGPCLREALSTAAGESGSADGGARAAGGGGELLVVHRLDRQTSGVIIFAKNLDAQRALSAQLLERRISKQYLALVRGSPPQDEGLIDVPL